MYTIREIGENIKNSNAFSGNVFFDDMLSSRTTMQVGGKAALIVEPKNEESLSFAIKMLFAQKLHFRILGGGSNIVAPDNYFEVPILSLRKLKTDIELISNESLINENNTLLKCGAGTSWGEIFKFCTEKKLSGLLEFTGLPGTVGGACFMNAGCFGLAISDVLEYAEYLSEDGKKHVYKMQNADWGYKKSPFQALIDKNVITSAAFRVHKSTQDVRAIGLSYIEKRKERGHYKKPSAGSVFRNPEGISAGKIIDDCALKGYRIGGAQIAPYHANIIINENNALQTEIKELVDYIVNIVKQKKNVQLIPEIIFW